MSDYPAVAVYGLLPSGALDPAYGNGGVMRLSLTGENLVVGAFSIDAEGRVLIVARRYVPDDDATAIRVARLLPSGVPDPSFGAAGHVVLEQETTVDYPWDVVADAGYCDRRAAGRPAMACGLDPRLRVRLACDGSLDASFADGGDLEINYGANVQGYPTSVEHAGEGRYLLGGPMGDEHSVFARLTTDGALDPAYGGTGVLSGPVGRLTDFALLPDGRLVIELWGSHVWGYDFSLAAVQLPPPVSAEPTPGDGGPGVLVVYPNPTSGVVRLRLSTGRGEPVEVSLIDATGRRLRVVHSGPVSGPLVLEADVSDLPAGLYGFHVNTARWSETRRFAAIR